MANRILFGLLLLTFWILPVFSNAQQANYVSNKLLIKYETSQRLKLQSNSKAEVERFLRSAGAQNIKPLFDLTQRQQLRQKRSTRAQALLQIHEIIFSRDIDPLRLAAKVERMPGIAYAEPKYMRKLHLTPNDSTLEKFIDFHNFPEAWDLTTGNPEVTIAVVDGGVGYTHPELDDKLWINQDEVPATLRSQVDQDGDGTTTSTEIRQYLQQNGEDYDGDGNINLDDALHPGSPFINQIDDDQNGFSDDLFGWDFWASGSGGQVTTDNNPIHDGIDHGTHVAGIAAAETNNNAGIAGSGFDSRYMAIKAGGTQADPRSIGFGFEGILYAVEQGADIINCSWGGNGFSQVEQDIINYATEQGAVIISSAGNEAASQLSYPAGYSNVLSVGSVDTNNGVASYSNYGYNLDILTTGSGILSTTYGKSLTTKSGTSMAAPVVSGAAALLKAIHPNWSAERIAQQIRTSAVSIDNANTEIYTHKLGLGKLDAFEALNTNKPGLKVTDARFVNSEGSKLQLNQSGMVDISIVNVGASASGIQASLQSLTNNGIELSTSTASIPSLATGDSAKITFDLTINEGFNFREIPTFRLEVQNTNGTYTDFSIIQYDQLLFDIIDANRVKTSFGADGTIGFTHPLDGQGGVGFIPKIPVNGRLQEGNNMLFEGGLMVEINGQIYDAVRAEENQLSRDFIPLEIFTTNDGADAVSDLDGHASFAIQSDSIQRARLDLHTYSYNNPQLRNTVLVKYTLRNPSSFLSLEDVYIGLFNDWDIGNSANNSTTFIGSDSLLYLSEDSPSSNEPIVAVGHLGPVSSIFAIDNAIEGSQDSLTFGLYDGFTEAEKRVALKAQKQKTTIQQTDASAVVASGPYTLAPGAEVTVGFVYAFGENPNQLRDQIAQARSQKPFAVSATGLNEADTSPTETKLFQNYPNPFRSKTQIRFNLDEASHVTLTIYDVLGRKVQVLRNEEMEANAHFVTFDASGLSSGVYFIRLKTEFDMQTIPMTLIK
ncbi:S8/S53 family peptidase [Fodinibius salsisoli]|uniref:S8 family peptidase n=1 Tax=Fodinibius salsisoli TaxID=2820877 RepID=A0ABT3PS62_9BACT|nr:S8/S53 family peptidase [Fodinibius salsisoli]MCW9708695.1 S8 family peptidase [Fodinibius salsisoli]